MAENGEHKKELSAPMKLQLTRTVESGKVQQTFSRGRSKTVAVEVKKTRTFSRQDGGALTETTAPSAARPATDDDQLPSNLTESERTARLRVLEQAANQPVSEKLDIRPSRPGVLKTKAEEAAPSLPESKTNFDLPKLPGLKIIDHGPTAAEDAEREAVIHTEKKKKSDKEEEVKVVKPKVGEDKWRKEKLTITNAAFFDQEERMRSLASIKRRREKAKRQSGDDGAPGEIVLRDVILPETITVQELANRLAVRSQEVVKELMKLGMMSKTTDTIDADTAELVVTGLGRGFKRVTDADIENILKQEVATPESLRPRPPVVTIMGHVDHGKTSLLDALRQTNVVAGEAGGITQHIGAYQIRTPEGDAITFLDTPGHAAFTAMRKRGAHVTDIVVLVVAADDGIMPQTIEAISHAKAAEVPIIVAVNKIDKPSADIERVKNELLSHELVAEDFGGQTIVVPISAKQRTNLDTLLEAILLQAEMLELQASPAQRAEGTVIEAEVDKGKGVMVTLLVQRGTLRVGDIVIAGRGFGKIKVITNDRGQSISEAGPSMPVEVQGFNELPSAGDEFAVTTTEKQARDVIDYRIKLQRDLRAAGNLLATTGENALEKMFRAAKDGGKELRIIVKGDVQGSVEAIIGSLEKISNDEVKVKFIHSGAGAISESDVTLASATGAIIVGFNVRAATAVKQLASSEKVDIRYYSIIYNLIDDMKGVVGGLMAPITRENMIGYAAIQQVFKVTKSGKVAGCKITEGIVKRGAGVRLLRDNVVIHEGKLKTLKRFKDDVAEVREGFECGMAFENYEDIKEGDVIECFEKTQEAAVVS